MKEFADGSFEWKQPGVDAEVRAIDFSPDGKQLATGNEDGYVRLWATESGAELARFNHDDVVVDLAFDPTGRFIVSSSKDGTARLWSLDGRREVGRISYGTGDDREVREVAFSPDGHFFAAISVGGRVCIWNVGKSIDDKCFNTRQIGLGLAYSPDGRAVATASEIDRGFAMPHRGKRVFNIDPPTSSNAMMQRAEAPAAQRTVNPAGTSRRA